jgi:hypothetical protein
MAGEVTICATLQHNHIENRPAFLRCFSTVPRDTDATRLPINTLKCNLIYRSYELFVKVLEYNTLSV